MNNTSNQIYLPLDINTNQFLQLLVSDASIKSKLKLKKVNRFAVIEPSTQDHLIIFQYLRADGKSPTAFNNVMNNEIKMVWSEFKKIIKPTQYKDKNFLPAMIPASIIKKPVFTVFDKKGIEYPRRCRDNINLYYCLFLDFDGELQVDDFIKQNVDIEYILYTTSSSTKEVNRFRVILPLLKPVEFKEIETRKNQLSNKFNLSKDMSTFSCSRLFYLPSKESEVYFNTGKFLDLTSMEQTIIRPKVFKFFQQSEDSIKKDRYRVCGYIENIKKLHHHKLHHDDLIKIVGAMQSVGLDSIINIVIKEIKDPSSKFNIKQAKLSVKSDYFSAGTLAFYAKG